MATGPRTRSTEIQVFGHPFGSHQNGGYQHMFSGEVADAALGAAASPTYGVPIAPFDMEVVGAMVHITTEVTGSDDTLTIDDGASFTIATLAIPATAAGETLFFGPDDFTATRIPVGTDLAMDNAGTATAGAYTVTLLCVNE